MGRLRARVVAELKSLVPAWIFFFVSFSLLRATQTALLMEHGIELLPPSRVLLGSLIVTKALLTVDAIRFFPRLEERPLLLSAAFRSLLYSVFLLAFQYVEACFELRAEGLAAASAEFARQLGTLRFWVIEAWILILLLLFGVARGLARRLGPERFRQMLVGR